MLRFSWVDEKKEFLKLGISEKEIKKMGKFGDCYECETIGKRLENFIGKRKVRYVDKLIKESVENVKSPKF
jgi:hypothetical protein